MKATGSNRERETALRTTLKKRLDEIDKVLNGDSDAVISGDEIPKSLKELRLLNIPDLEIFPIGSPATLNRKQSPHLRDLIDRAQDVVTRCKSFRHRPVARRLSVTARNRLLSRRVRIQKIQIASLVRALHEAENARDLMENAQQSVQRQLAIEKKRVAELQRASGRFPLAVVRSGD